MTLNFKGSSEDTERLANALTQLSSVVASAARHGRSANAEAWQIATALADIRESSDRLFSDLVPSLLQASVRNSSADEVLNDIGEEYRHILYHILDTKLFDYIVERGE